MSLQYFMLEIFKTKLPGAKDAKITRKTRKENQIWVVQATITAFESN